MNFNDKQLLVDKYLDKVYTQILEDFDHCNKYNLIKSSFDIEYKKLYNYSTAILDELKNELSDELRECNFSNTEELLYRFEEVAKGFKLPSIHINEETFIETIRIEEKHSKSDVTDRNNVARSIIIGSGAGVVVGAGIGMLIGKAAVPVFISSLIGCFVGGTAGYNFTNNINVRDESKNSTQSIKKTIIRIDKNKLKLFTIERKKTIKNLFRNYINNFENIYNEISMR